MRRIRKYILNILHEHINKRNRKRLISSNTDAVTIIANNCIGGYIYHWLHLRFDSPTINLFILPSDYIRMLSDFDKFFDPDAIITEVLMDKPYPVADIYGCKIYFMHYKCFAEAVEKWRERCARINRAALCIIMTDRDGCTIDDMNAFDALSYPKKVLFTHQLNHNISCAYYIKGFEKNNCVGNLHETMSITGKRYIDQFDYVSFLSK